MHKEQVRLKLGGISVALGMPFGHSGSKNICLVSHYLFSKWNRTIDVCELEAHSWPTGLSSVLRFHPFSALHSSFTYLMSSQFSFWHLFQTNEVSISCFLPKVSVSGNNLSTSKITKLPLISVLETFIPMQVGRPWEH